MNLHLQKLSDLIEHDKSITEDQKNVLIKFVMDANKDIEILAFKLDRTEKVKRTTAILLEETIEELEQKRKAIESTNRDLEIESSLERVRTVAMGMRKPDDMLQVCRIISEQLELLKVKEIRNVQTAIIYESKSSYLNYEYYAKYDKTFTTEVDFKNHPIQERFANQMLTGAEELFTENIEGQELQKWLAYQKTTNQFADVYLEDASSLNYYWYSLGHVALGISAYAPLSAEEIILFKRFRNVFDLAYRRFIDIEKAEAQARESQIELALERVRARTMAMQKSEELPETSYLLFQQLKELGAVADQLSIGILNEAAQTMELSVTLHGSPLQKTYTLKLDEPFVVSKSYAAWKANKKSVVITLTGKDLEDYNAYRNNLSEIKFNKTNTDNKWVVNCAFFSKGWLSFSSVENVPAETIKLLERFTAVFDQTYTRFLDLQKAEAQTREAQIETAVERVRAQSMAMYKTSDLYKVNEEILSQLNKLTVTGLTGVSIYLVDENDVVTVWDLSSPGNISNPNSYSFKYDSKKYPVLGGWIAQWKTSEEDYFVLDHPKQVLIEGIKEIEEILPEMAVHFKNAIESGQLKHQWNPAGRLSDGLLSIDLVVPPTEDTKNIVTKMAGAFNLAYLRFEDLQKAEAQTREAQIEAALEKVRSRSLAMHNANELGEVVVVIVEKIKGLNIEMNGGVTLVTFIPGSKDFLEWHANPNQSGDTLTRVLSYFDHTIFNDCVAAKEQGMELLTKVYSKEEKDSYINYLAEHTEYLPDDMVQWIGEQPYMGFSFAIQKHSGIFLQDFTGKFFSKEENNILIRFSRVFEQSYIRFLDLQKAERQAHRAEEDLIEIKLARKKAEETLTELKATQSQLIQSEKMASLGELTAGIAHEIQNPLNFVNNFSEVSNELIDEMNAELDKGDIEEAKLIAADVKQNLEKINHHGKRADAIVKGMLQHSRSSSGQKEPTDINKLADEYLRLAYHGLRAKDKSFNATMKTDYDESIGNINIIPQDIGRVVLNLITNAFYAVDEKKRICQTELVDKSGQVVEVVFEPTVSVSTKKINNAIEISVSDNGNGIPQNILDKIFQPFFTTKPTGQGTGLGLSMSYDIVKAHGGELQVETKEGVGTTFIIKLSA